MRTRSRFQTVVLGLTASAMLAPCQMGLGAEPPGAPENSQEETQATVDVALGAGGVLQGQVLHGHGNAVVGQEISVVSTTGATSRAVTDAQGRFRVTGLRGGTYAVASGNAGKSCRLWAQGAAPPGANTSVLLVEQQEVVRGSLASHGAYIGGVGGGGLLMLGLASGIVAGGIIAQEHASGS